MSSSSIPQSSTMPSSEDSHHKAGTSTPPIQKKLYLLRHPRNPRLTSVDATQHVYDYSKYVTPISALTPSKLLPSREVRRRQVPIAIPDSVIRYYEKLEPFLFPILFPLGLASATLQSLPMVLSVLPLAFLFGLATVVVVPIICIGGVTVSSYVLARAVVKLLSKQAGGTLNATNLLLLAKKWNGSLLQHGMKLGGTGVHAVKSAVEAVMMGTVALGALASLQSQPIPAVVEDEDEIELSSAESNLVPEAAQKDKQTARDSQLSRPRSTHVNFAAPDLPATSVSLPSSPSPSKASAKAQSIFQSLLLAPNNQALAYQTADEVGSEYSAGPSREPSDSRTAVPIRSALARSSRRASSSTTTSSPSASPSYSAAPSYYSLFHFGSQDPQDNAEGLTTPNSVSTPGYTPMTPMTPMTPHLHYQQLPSTQSLTGLVSGTGGRVGKTVSFALPEEPSSPYAVSSLQAALSRLNAERMEASEENL